MVCRPLIGHCGDFITRSNRRPWENKISLRFKQSNDQASPPIQNLNPRDCQSEIPVPEEMYSPRSRWTQVAAKSVPSPNGCLGDSEGGTERIDEIEHYEVASLATTIYF